MDNLIYQDNLLFDLYILRNTLPDGMVDINSIIERVKDADRLELEEYEWCDGCKEYDNEHHHCPRYNRCIRSTFKELCNNRWKPVEEELPQRSGKYLCTVDIEKAPFAFFESNDVVSFQEFNAEQGSFGRWITELPFNGEESEPKLIWDTLPITAWMIDKPEPYRPE